MERWLKQRSLNSMRVAHCTRAQQVDLEDTSVKPHLKTPARRQSAQPGFSDRRNLRAQHSKWHACSIKCADHRVVFERQRPAQPAVTVPATCKHLASTALPTTANKIAQPSRKTLRSRTLPHHSQAVEFGSESLNKSKVESKASDNLHFVSFVDVDNQLCATKASHPADAEPAFCCLKSAVAPCCTIQFHS